MVQWLKLCLPMKGVWVGSLVRKPRSHMPCGQKNIKKYKQYCNKDFKNGSHKKKPLKNKGIKVMKDKYKYEKCSNSVLIKNIH